MFFYYLSLLYFSWIFRESTLILVDFVIRLHNTILYYLVSIFVYLSISIYRTVYLFKWYQFQLVSLVSKNIDLFTKFIFKDYYGFFSKIISFRYYIYMRKLYILFDIFMYQEIIIFYKQKYNYLETARLDIWALILSRSIITFFLYLSVFFHYEFIINGVKKGLLKKLTKILLFWLALKMNAIK